MEIAATPTATPTQLTSATTGDQPGSREATGKLADPARKRCRLVEEPADDDGDYTDWKTGGPRAQATSYTNLWQFVDKVALKVGMTQANLVEDFDMRREPGAFHGVRQHTAALFENELDRYSWVLGGGGGGRAHGGEAIYDSPDWPRLGDHRAEESWALPVGGSFPHVSHPSQSA